LPLARLIKSDCEAGRGAARRGEAKRGEAGIYHNNNNIDNIDSKFNINNNNNNCVATTAQSQNGQVHVSTKTSIRTTLLGVGERKRKCCEGEKKKD
jgi:hypothetical protein